MTYIATFFSHYSAATFAKIMQTKGVSAKLMPVPRRVSSSCGTCVRLETAPDAAFYEHDGLDKIFTLEGSVCKLIYENPN